MRHCDPATLALLALGEPVGDADRYHLEQCSVCQTQADQNRAVVRAARTVTPEDQLSDPPEEVWSRVGQELGLRSDLRPFVPPPDTSTDTDEPNVISLDQWRQRSSALKRKAGAWTVAAAVAGIAVGALGVAGVAGLPDGGGQATPIASSGLSVVPVADGGTLESDPAATGEAVLVEQDGQSYVEVNASRLPELGGYYEVWLIRSDLSGMISLGALTAGSQGRFTVPAGIDPDEYAIVDVSAEQLDGDPTHSRESLLRGQWEV